MENLVNILKNPDNIPIVGLLFIIPFYVWLWWREARRNDRRLANGEFEKMKAEAQDRIHTWPYLTRNEFLSAIIVMIILTVWSILLDAPLEEPANPSRTPNPSKAPWYFLGLQEMLVYFDPWIAGVVLPTLIIMGLMAIPYIDPNKKGNGYYTFKERPFAISIFLFGFLVLWLSLIMLGTFLRGPGWNFFAPWELWDPHKVVAMVNVDLHEVVGIRSKLGAGLFGLAVVGGYFALIPIYWFWKRDKSEILKTLGPLRYSVTAFLLLSMMGLVIKMFLRIAFNIKYIWVTPWFNV
ncbi:MAG: cytochrome C [candidate division KSB1 bacterium]|nr:cytochrome C [candidate division KSB1 bacterium]MDZ7288135.1 cytochrome C [candidate division KSB1 bacterium]MDZ7300352.1 cytochrome C [candidate division KSB1 bacterium]MDZ7306165.1 cytochrome C [candidate division KSB1 bacterium]MDZ7351352.1 cytochrome C [candidate division KSB1 bacterium]